MSPPCFAEPGGAAAAGPAGGQPSPVASSTMFIDIVTAPREEVELVDEKAGLFSNPPDGLAAAIAWEADDDNVSVLMVWETPGARGDFGAEKMMSLVEAGAVTTKPEIVTPFRVFLRS